MSSACPERARLHAPRVRRSLARGGHYGAGRQFPRSDSSSAGGKALPKAGRSLSAGGVAFSIDEVPLARGRRPFPTRRRAHPIERHPISVGGKGISAGGAGTSSERDPTFLGGEGSSLGGDTASAGELPRTRRELASRLAPVGYLCARSGLTKMPSICKSSPVALSENPGSTLIKWKPRFLKYSIVSMYNHWDSYRGRRDSST